MNVKEIVAAIHEKHPDIYSVFFVGCGASESDLYPAKYFLDKNASRIRASLHTAHEFFYSTPKAVGPEAIVVTCSLSGGTPETVKASRKAMELGAAVISVTMKPESELAKASDYQIIHGFFESYGAKIEKMGNVLGLACDKSVSQLKPRASEFGINYKDMDNIYVMSSGASAMVAYSFSMFLMMEMQQIPSPSFNDGNFFHGPFELVDKDVPYLLLMNDGPTRPMDSRAMEFIQRFDGKLTVVDAKDFGLGNFVDSSVIEYFNPLLLSGVLRLYAEELAEQRSHPLTLRKYMWKIDY